jgi:hypothetical protein
MRALALKQKENDLARRPRAIPFRVTVDLSISFPIQNKVSLETSRNTSMPKFMQTLNDSMYRDLEKVAKQRGITVQELIRAVILPDWLSKEDHAKKH